MKTFIAINLKICGVNPEENEIIEIAAVKFHNGEVEKFYSSLVSTALNISSTLTATNSVMGREVLSIEEINNDLLGFVEHYPLVFHDATSNINFIKKIQLTLTNPYFDTLELAKMVYPTLGSYNLIKLAESFNLKTPTQGIICEAQTCGLLFLKLIKKLEEIPLGLLNYYVNMFNTPPSYLGDFLQRMYLERIKQNPIFQTTTVFGFTKNSKEFFEDKTSEKLENPVIFHQQEILNLFDKESQFAAAYPNFEFRPAQAQMLAQICQAFADDKFLIIEAATGTGKSLAYLIPSIFWSLAHNEKVVVSTQTINLQEQLSLKDIPLLQKVLDFPFKAAVIKGRKNYLCLAKWQNKLQNPEDLSIKEKYFLARITTWLQETQVGDKEELNISLSEEGLWSQVCADSYTCLGKLCPWLDNCFVFQARKNADQAHIVITNHSLLLTDAKHENKILPKHSYLIIDEAHNLEQEATNQLTVEFSSFKLKNLLYSLYHSKGRFATGILNSLKNQLKKYGNFPEDVENTLNETINLVIDLYTYLDNLTQGLVNLDDYLGQSDNKEKWLKEEVYQFAGWEFIQNCTDNLILGLNLLAKNLILLSNFLDEEREDISESKKYQAYAELCKEYGENGRMLEELENQDNVTWLEIVKDKSSSNFILKSAPINVGPLINELVFKNKRSVIFTSATLAVEKRFDFFINQVGLNYLPSEQLISIIIDSPYNISDQAKLYIANNLPNPNQVSEEEFGQKIALAIEKMVVANQGRALVLFTSHRLLRQVYHLIRDSLAEKEINVFGHQIDGNRSYLIEEFKKTPQGVIFGTSSFWEGVDIPGDDLTLIIMVKLPFQPPTQPTLAARMEYLKACAKNPFYLLNLPQAIIKFKQGFGRLIRTSKDQGVVVVLDKRLMEKSYGPKFLNSLPIKTHFRGSVEEIANIIAANK